MNLPSVAIVILNWNGEKLLQQFLPSVLATTYPNKQIIVADNASTDNSISVVKSNFPTVNIIENKTNAGFAKGYNEALAKVDADIFVLLNSDVEVTPNWVEPIVALMESDKNIGICQPKILNQMDNTKFDYAGAAGGYIDFLGYPFAKGRVFETVETDLLQYESNDTIFWASGAAMFVRSSIYKELGGLDENFFAHQEEIDFCWRTQLLGYKVNVCTAAVVYHVGGATLQQGSPQKTYLNFRNNLLMLHKNLPFWNGLFIIGFRLSLDGAAAFHFLLKGQGKSFLAVVKAHLHFIRILFFGKKEKHLLPKRPLKMLNGTIAQSIVYNYFVQGKKTFKEIFNKTV